VRFVDLEGYPRFFDDVRLAFPPRLAMVGRSPGGSALGVQASTLEVHDVGEFEASFVPTQADFERLDARFRLDPAVWAQLPQYADWGFAVFYTRKRRGEWI